ncbi:amino acid adenylation domain-containing protein, partial [Chitinophaga eiseniae]
MSKKAIHAVFEQVAQTRPSAIAIESGKEHITYQALNILANRIAFLLQQAGAGKDNIVNIVMPSSVPYVGALLAVLKRGSIFLPVDLSFPKKRLEQVLTETFDGIAIVAAAWKDDFLLLAAEMNIVVVSLIVIDDTNIPVLLTRKNEDWDVFKTSPAVEWDHNPHLEVNGEESCYIYYTSGSTGKAKAIVGKNVSLSHFIHWQIREFNIDAGCRVTQLAQVTFDASLRDIFVALIAGGTLCIPDTATKGTPALLLRWLEQQRITIIHCVPSLFRVLTQERAATANVHLEQLKYIFTAGEMLYGKDIVEWRKYEGEQAEIVSFYGPTETTMIKTFYRIGPKLPAGKIPAGIPISNTVVAVIDNDRRCAPGETGEIYIKTPFATKGYYNNPALTSEYFVQNPLQQDVTDIVYKTGDLGRLLPDGNIEIVGRADNQVKINGIRLELEEVELAILQQEQVTSVVVKAHHEKDNSLMLAAYYTGAPIAAESFHAFLAPLLNKSFIPSYFIHLEAFPLNKNGKVDRSALFLPGPGDGQDDAADRPQGETEERVAAQWKAILGNESLGRNTSFFASGGNSLKALLLLSRIKRDLGVSLKITDILGLPTIREQAAFIDNSLHTGFEAIPIVAGQASYPVSAAQRRIWVLSQFEEGNTAYNIPGACTFENAPDIPALEYAFTSMLSRHESLRTVFRDEGSDGIRQFILEAGSIRFRIGNEDFREEKDVLQKLTDFSAAPFDLTTGPLLRAGLFRTGQEEWVFVCCMHHIISDGWSVNVFIRELLHFYDAFLHQRKPSLSPLRIQYKDYAAWQQAQLLKDENENGHKLFWLQLLEGELPVLDLATDKLRPAIKTFRGDIVKQEISSANLARIKTSVARNNSTLFTHLLSLVNILLFRYTNQEDIIIGCPVAGRQHTDLEDQIGVYVNMLPVRLRFSGSDAFSAILGKANSVTMAALEHQHYPFDVLVDSLNLKRDTSRNPIFDVALVVHDYVKPQASADETLHVKAFEGISRNFSKFDLTFNFQETAAELRLNIEYNTDLFYRDTIIRMGKHFLQLLEVALSAPETAVGKLDYLSSTEKDYLRHVLDNSAVPYPATATVTSLFESQVAATPDNIAVVCGDTRL